jgi:hypothetical protein
VCSRVQDSLQREHHVVPGSGSAKQDAIDAGDDGEEGIVVVDGLHGDYERLAKILSGKVNRISDLKAFLEANPPGSISPGDVAESLQMHNSYSMMLSSLRRASRDVGGPNGPPPSFFSAQSNSKLFERSGPMVRL